MNVEVLLNLLPFVWFSVCHAEVVGDIIYHGEAV